MVAFSNGKDLSTKTCSWELTKSNRYSKNFLNYSMYLEANAIVKFVNCFESSL